MTDDTTPELPPLIKDLVEAANRNIPYTGRRPTIVVVAHSAATAELRLVDGNGNWEGGDSVLRAAARHLRECGNSAYHVEEIAPAAGLSSGEAPYVRSVVVRASAGEPYGEDQAAIDYLERPAPAGEDDPDWGGEDD